MKNKIYDILVVGSGLSSLCFIDGYLKKNKSINVISFKKNKKNFNQINNKHILKILPPQMIGHEKQVEDYFSINRIKIDPKSKFFGALEFGGLSNYWGLQIDQNISGDISHLSISTQNKIKNSFIEIFNKQHLLGKIDKKNQNLFLRNEYIDKNLVINDKSIILTEPVIAFKKKSNKGEKIDLKKINEEKDKLTAINFYNKNLKDKNIKFHNYFVKKIVKHKKGLSLHCSNGHQNKNFLTKKLVLGCGTLITTKLIMDYLNYSKEIKINHHPRIFSVYFSKTKWKNNMKFQPSHLHLKSKKKQDLFTADFRPGNKIIMEAVIKFKKFLAPFEFFLQSIRENFIFSNIFLHPKYSNLYLKRDDNNLYKIYSKKKETNKIFKKVVSIPFNFLKKTSKILPFKIDYFPGFGADFHYFGTILMGKAGKLSVNEKCQLSSNKKIYIIDGSTLNFRKNKYPLGLIMANSRRVGKEI